MTRILPGLRRGVMSVPASKSHAHRVLIAEFLAGRTASLAPADGDCDDIAATKRCLMAIGEFRPQVSRRACGVRAASDVAVPLDCGESGTTRRLLGPVVAALGVRPQWIMKGRLAMRPQLEYPTLQPGVHELDGDVSSQFVSGLLLALPLLGGDSEIVLRTPLASRGYVALTLGVMKAYGVQAKETATGFLVPGGQAFSAPEATPRIETDWSGAAFPLAMSALGNEIKISEASRDGLRDASLQPDAAVASLLARLACAGDVELDVDGCPDLFPVLSVVAAHRADATRFAGIRRLRLKESDRVAAMADVLSRFGITTAATEDAFEVYGRITPLQGGSFSSYADHRIAMSLAVGATVADAPVEIDNTACADKSYPGFFSQFAAFSLLRLH